jgi:hypothetical protein
MEGILSLIFLATFLVGVLVMATWKGVITFTPTARLLRQADQSDWTLKQFLNLNLSRPKAKEKFFFSEESVVSVGHRYNGRFDGAILHWENVPVLDAIIERKFPVRYLPDKPRPEDVFQAGLYALALMEKGVSCSSTKLAIVYCLQNDARKCLDRNENKCFTCSNSKVFERRFKSRSIVKHLKKFDDFWYRDAKAKPSPELGKCRACPNGKNGTCNYSAA